MAEVSEVRSRTIANLMDKREIGDGEEVRLESERPYGFFRYKEGELFLEMPIKEGTTIRTRDAVYSIVSDDKAA